MGPKGIQNLKEIVDFGFAIQKAGAAALADGKIGIEDFQLIFGVIPTVQPAFSDLGEAVPELTDLDGAEAAELTAYIVGKGTLPEHAAKVLEKSLKVAAAAWDLYKTLKEEPAPVTPAA